MKIERKEILVGNEGFTLLELLISMAIITVGMLGPLSMQIHGMKSNQFGLSTTKATLISKMYMEDLEATSYTALASEPCMVATQMETVGGINYSVNCTITPAGGGATWSTVEVRVSWSGMFDMSRSVTMTTVRDG